MIRGRSVSVVAVIAMIAALIYWNGTASPRKSDAVAPPPKAAVPAPSVSKATPVQAPNVTRPSRPQGPQAPDLPFSFFGKTTEKGEGVILLHGGGRTLRVRGVGPLTDDYEVVAIHDNHIVLRYLPLGTEQKLELAARANAITFDSPADLPQD